MTDYETEIPAFAYESYNVLIRIAEAVNRIEPKITDTPHLVKNRNEVMKNLRNALKYLETTKRKL